MSFGFEGLNSKLTGVQLRRACQHQAAGWQSVSTIISFFLTCHRSRQSALPCGLKGCMGMWVEECVLPGVL